MARPDKLRTKSGNELSPENSEGTAARTRPFSMDDILRRRGRKKMVANTEITDVKMTLDVRAGENACDLRGSGTGRHTNSGEIVKKPNILDSIRNKSNNTKEMVQDGSFKGKQKEIIDVDSSFKVVSRKEKSKDRGHTDENKRSHCQREEVHHVGSRTGAEKTQDREARLKSKIGDKGRDSEREDNRERKRRHQADQYASVGRKLEVEGNDAKKHASHRRQDESYSDRKGRKKISSKIPQDASREETRSKRRRSSSREHRDRHRTRDRSLSASPKEHKRISFREREYGDSSYYSYKEKHGPKHHEVDKSRRNSSGSGGHYRQYGDSGIGGYSPRKRRSEAAVKTPSPTVRSPERRSAAWDVKPAGAENGASVAALASLNSSQISLSSFPAVSPVISTAPNPYPASTAIAVSSIGNNVPEDAVQLTQATRPSRRLYVENIPPSTSDKELIECFNKFLLSSGGNHIQGRQPCISCMVNHEKNQALVEFLTPEDATTALSFDGNSFAGAVLRMKRPKDFMEAANGALDKFEAIVDPISDFVKDSPHKIFIGGIAKALSSNMLKEIVSAFGHLKAYHFESQEFGLSCAFLEYADGSVTQKACAGLNGMKLGGHAISVVQAIPGASEDLYESSSGSPCYGIPEHARPLLEDPTPVLKLMNMFSEEDFGFLSEPDLEEILEDVRLECVRFGSVKSVNIVRRTASSILGIDVSAVSDNGVTESLLEWPAGDVETMISTDEHRKGDGAITGAIGDEPDDGVGEQNNQVASEAGADLEKPASNLATMEPKHFDPEYENNTSMISNDDVLGIRLSPRDVSRERNLLIPDKNDDLEMSGDDMVNAAPSEVQKPEYNNELQKEPGEKGRIKEDHNELQEAPTEANEVGQDNSDAKQEQEGTIEARVVNLETGDEPREPIEAEQISPQKNDCVEPAQPVSDSPIFEPGTIFVEFTRKEGACTAAHSLYGRLFVGRTVTTGYVPLHLYKSRFPR